MLREGSQWVYEIKLDGYRAIAVKARNQVSLFSRRRKLFNGQYPYIVEALADLPDDTVIDGEIVALDDSGRPEFNLLQNYRSAAAHIHYFVFDLLVHQGRGIEGLPFEERRRLLRSLKFSSTRIHLVEYHETSGVEMLAAVKGLGLEGVIGKRKDSRYESGKRSGAWVKCRIHKGQELVIGGYFPGPHGFDSIIIGYYRGKDLVYVARTRNGFVPGVTEAGVCETQGQGNSKLPVCEPARYASHALRSRTRCGGNEKGGVAAARTSGANRVSRMDRR
jgi:ATP-dependent DNA ligase